MFRDLFEVARRYRRLHCRLERKPVWFDLLRLMAVAVRHFALVIVRSSVSAVSKCFGSLMAAAQHFGLVC